MRFCFEGVEYSFGFQYAKTELVREIAPRHITAYCGEPVLIGGKPNQSVMVTLTETAYEVSCCLYRLEPLLFDAERFPRDGTWVLIDVRKAFCSLADRYERAIGREIALGRYKPSSSLASSDPKAAEFYDAMRAAWDARRRPRAAKEGAQ